MSVRAIAIGAAPAALRAASFRSRVPMRVPGLPRLPRFGWAAEYEASGEWPGAVEADVFRGDVRTIHRTT
jgi:hypothetical protein